MSRKDDDLHPLLHSSSMEKETKIPVPQVSIGRESQSNRNMKTAILIWLTLQNSIHTLLIRYSRAREVEDMFVSTVAVWLTEVIKCIICLFLVAQEETPRRFLSSLRAQIIEQPYDTLKVCIPAMIYIVQNNLFYVAASHLDAATFMITSQLKIFTAAIFTVIILRRSLNQTQWFALGVLFIGVSLVQLQGTSSTAKIAGESPLVGFIAVVVACCLSGFAGIYFEKILKGSAPVSLWMRNVQMAVFAIPSSFLAIYVSDSETVTTKGLLYGFDSIVWLTVLWYGIGGLSVAVCIKYADNIAKNFATSVAIVLSTIGSMFLFDFIPSLTFIFGASLVIFSIFLYSSHQSMVSALNRLRGDVPSISKESFSMAKAEVIKYTSLIVLVVQNCSLVLFMRYVMTNDRPKFLKTISVFFGEIFKFSVSLIFACVEEKSLVKGLKRIYTEFVVNWKDTLKVLVPAAVYTVQNFLLYVAVDNLPAATYMVTYQLKILTTAVFTVLVLKRKLSIQQWMALLVLFSGVVIVQYDQKMSNDKEKELLAISKSVLTLDNTTIETPGTSTLQSIALSEIKNASKKGGENSIFGFVAVLIACILSGFAGIYFEKILKGSNVSIWIRNIQLALPSIFFAFLFASVKDNSKVYADGPSPPEVWKNMLQGFDWAVWVTVAINAFGGLVVAVVIKYADNILKAFATSFAIVLNCIAAFFLFTFRPTMLFVLGASAVIAAVFVYSMYPYRSSHVPVPTQDPKDVELQEASNDQKA
ncbi:unnamed protein product [Caenorhabditis angaria]|uniref:Uncharacterized protein n=1 Tax=Caenorhabditis angaria TaxID=860376 RepID=A0A9P1N3W5_9PELO|nr:unnamed protein product [Caenorhabditis angaria]